MLPYCRLCDVTQPKLNMQNQIIEFLRIILLQMFYILLILDISNRLPKINQLYENNYFYETNFNFYEISLNIQNGSTNVKIFNCL